MVEFRSGAARRDPACPLRAQNRPERDKSLRYAPNRALHSSIISKSSYTPLAEPLKTRNQLSLIVSLRTAEAAQLYTAIQTQIAPEITIET